MSLLVKENNKQELDLSKLPIRAYFDESTQSIVLESDYNIVFKSKCNIINIAEKNNILIGDEVHLNPSNININKLTKE